MAFRSDFGAGIVNGTNIRKSMPTIEGHGTLIAFDDSQSDSCGSLFSSPDFHRYFPHDTFLRRTQWLIKKQGWLLSHAGITNLLFKSFARRKTEDGILKNGALNIVPIDAQAR